MGWTKSTFSTPENWAAQTHVRVVSPLIFLSGHKISSWVLYCLVVSPQINYATNSERTTQWTKPTGGPSTPMTNQVLGDDSRDTAVGVQVLSDLFVLG